MEASDRLREMEGSSSANRDGGMRRAEGDGGFGGFGGFKNKGVRGIEASVHGFRVGVRSGGHDKEKGFGSKRLNPFLASTFKYKKGTGNTSETDSAVCLTDFEDDEQNPFLASTFKCKKGTGNTSETDCAVCLTDFEDDEHVRQLPRCKHSFHAPCIDMWLYSHSDCPLCHTTVDRLSKQPEENSSR
ncbi:hypothetical protein F2P56_016320 [Juglans regia]|uniref:RING-type E3 ubiquitin transferase n=2 Tax=Juglans regia TaxID=51240 RepID=A0A2I4FLT3_JUGRE|nr:RING-H2 finger protein ATL38-like [Juglans regia]KAF5466394.1 hypothetical protein F2P56_016320 [Juglans regia]